MDPNKANIQKVSKDSKSSDSSELMSFLQSVSTDEPIRVEENFGDGYVRLIISEAERRQAKHDIRCVEDIVIELLRNSRDASAHSIFVATTKEGDIRTISIIDDGAGVPEHMHSAIFEPRVTSKLDTMVMDTWGVHGRGMALFSIASNSKEAKVMCSRPEKGCSIFVKVDTSSLSEKTDQSSFPQIKRDEGGELTVAKGPHNINRKVMEFALDCRHDIDIYLGSPAEIVATLICYGEKNYNSSDLLFTDNTSELPVCRMLNSCATADELSEIAENLGLVISERTAHRILRGQIKPLKEFISLVTSKSQVDFREKDIFKDSRALKISSSDIEAFSRRLEEAFEPLSKAYYVSLLDEPEVKVSKQKIQVNFLIEKE